MDASHALRQFLVLREIKRQGATWKAIEILCEKLDVTAPSMIENLRSDGLLEPEMMPVLSKAGHDLIKTDGVPVSNQADEDATLKAAAAGISPRLSIRSCQYLISPTLLLICTPMPT